MITFRVDPSDVAEGLAALGAESPKAIARAINRTVANVKTAMVRPIASSLRIKQAYVRERITTTQATSTRLVARMSASNTQIPLTAFNAKGPEPSRGKGNGVTANTQQRRYPHAFLAKMRSGHRGVFQRVGKARLKIREVREASVAAVFIRHEAVGQARGNEQLPKNLQHEVNNMLRTKVQRSVRQAAGI